MAELAALVAFEGLGAEAAGGASARRAFHALALRLVTRRLRTLSAAAAGVRAVAAAVLISTMLVFAIVAQMIHLMKT